MRGRRGWEVVQSPAVPVGSIGRSGSVLIEAIFAAVLLAVAILSILSWERTVRRATGRAEMLDRATLELASTIDSLVATRGGPSTGERSLRVGTTEIRIRWEPIDGGQHRATWLHQRGEAIAPVEVYFHLPGRTDDGVGD